MKAILLAAGQGTRLRPLTNDKPKCMVEYHGKPLLNYILSSFKSLGIDQIIGVTGYAKDKIEHLFTKSYYNTNFDKTNMVYSLFCAEESLNDDIIISYTDIIYRPRILEELIKSQHEISVVVDKDWKNLWLQRMENPLLDAETLKIKNGQITELGRKAKDYSEIEGQYIGLIKIKKSALERVKDFYHRLDKNANYQGKDFNNMYMTTFLQLIIEQLMPIYPVWTAGGWLEIDSPDDLNCKFSE
jgi:choline kinase